MEEALFAFLVLLVFLFVLNGMLNGRLKDRVDAILCVVWLCLQAAIFYWFGWKGLGTALALTAIGATVLYPLARMIANFLYSHPPRG